MKTLSVAVVCCLSALVAFCSEYSPDFMQAMTKGAKARVSLKVVDDEGVFVPRVKVRVQMGMNFEERSYWIDGETDEDGAFLVEGVTTGNKIAIGLSKDGYYNSNRELHFIRMGFEHAVTDGKWLPWGKEERIVLRKIRNPVSLVSVRDAFYIPVTNEWVGFDMEAKDWVFRGCRGKHSDFEVFFSWDGKSTGKSKLLKLDARFSEKDSGFYMEDYFPESSFAGVYIADTNRVFKKNFSYELGENRRVLLTGVEPSKICVIRSRCEHDEKGNLVKANYSALGWFKIGGSRKGKGEMPMSYVFNPTPNDINLENVDVSRRLEVQHKLDRERGVE